VIATRAQQRNSLKEKAELMPLIVSLAKDTAIRQNKSGMNVTVSRSSFKIITEETMVNLDAGQTTTSREKRDLRNMISMACNHAFAD